MKKITATMLSLIVLAGFALMAMGSGSDDSVKVETGGTANSAETTVATEETLKVNVGDVLETNTLKITYAECEKYTGYSEYLPPAEGNMIYRLKIEVVNISDSDQFISSFDFNCYADNTAATEYYGDDVLSATVSAGRSASGYLYFEVPVDAENVEVEYETDIWTGSKAIFVVK